MGLLSKFKFGSKSSTGQAPAAGASSEPSDVVREARVRARRRLIGASLLLGVGIVGFPLLFESRPRPIPVDIPIEIPAREGAAPLAPPPARATPIRAQTSAMRSAEPLAAVAENEVVASAPPASAAKPAASKPAADKPELQVQAPKVAASKPESKPTPRPEAKSDPKPEPKPAPAKPEPKPAPAKPETKPVAKTAEHTADDGRYVVQIGAFAEATSAREARMKVEGLGLKTYTQVIESSTGRRIRVRVGPYASKAEADKAAARIKSGGLQAAVLLL